jgi:APA family basic amino acid/polyamine antiporter
MTASNQRPELARVLSFPDLVAITIGVVIGSGIFLVPGIVLRDVGEHVPVALGVWVLGGVLSLLGALTYGELGAMMPEAGGPYVYIRDAFGPLPAFLYGWVQFFVVASGSVATLAVASALYANQLVALPAAWLRAIPLLVIAVSAVLNVWGTRQSATVQALLTFLKGSAIVIMGIALFAAAGLSTRGTAMATAATSAAPTGPGVITGLALALVATLWAYEGWSYVTCSAGEARNPQRTFAAGLIVGTGVVIALYLFANVAYLHALGPAAVAHSDHVAADAVAAAYGPGAARVMALVVEISVCSALNSVILTTPRIYYAMARDGVFFPKLAEVHPRFGTPAFAIVAGSVWALALAATGTYEQLLTYVVCTSWVFYAVGALTIFWYRRHRPAAARPFRVPGYPLTPVVFVVAAALVVGSVLIGRPMEAIKGFVILLIGVPVYYLWRRWRASVARDAVSA